MSNTKKIEKSLFCFFADISEAESVCRSQWMVVSETYTPFTLATRTVPSRSRTVLEYSVNVPKSVPFPFVLFRTEW